ncbi:MAG TPA: UvrD-helicase domain-containing protein, partial [Patescibacteria group bacterium]|nr:UvrD-helicase domain-containing protein [Patescibacteria group bacterium]
MPTSGKPIEKLRAKHSKTFQKLFDNLNTLQKKAVNTLEGPVMVLAGPGTGKTQVLAMRIAKILQETDTAPHNILALTFTESASKAMRERLLTIIGEEAYYVQITTFHSFCSDVIQSNPEYFPFSRQAEPLSDLERFTVLESIIESQPFQAIKPINSPLFYIKDCIRAIQDLKREGVSPDSLRVLIDDDAAAINTEELSDTDRHQKERNIEKQRELLQVYLLYQQALIKRGRYDYEDMIFFVSEMFRKHVELLRIYQERIQFVLIDEYQDTNAAQNAVAELLVSYWGEHANIFVVGDADQSLYRFQGASIENSLAFLERYPKANVISLEQNYRSTQSILDAAHNLISRNTLTNDRVVTRTGKKVRLKPLISQEKKYGVAIRVAEFSSDPTETIFIAEEVSALIHSGVKPSEIAILYRTNADSAAIEDALVKWGIKYEIDGGVDVLETPIIQQFLSLCSVVHRLRSKQEDLELFTVLNYPWSRIDPLDILRASREAATKRIGLYDVVSDDTAYNLSLKKPEELRAFVNRLAEWLHADAELTFPQWFEKVLNESGLLQYVLESPVSMEHMNRLQSLFREVKLMAAGNHNLKLADFLESVERMREHGIAVREEDMNVHVDAVKLTTAHSAKGLEWQHVFIARAVDGKWGNVRVRNLIPLPEGLLKQVRVEEKEQNEDERRLFYVSLTRAKQTVTVTYAKTAISGNRSRQHMHSMFIEELPKKYQEQFDSDEFEKKSESLLRRLLQQPTHPEPTIDEQEWIQGLLRDFVLTPTALNTFLECPYKFKLNSLVKVPRAKQDYLSFGTAIHRALELLFRWIMQYDVVPEKEKVIGWFEEALRKEVMSVQQEEARLNQGRKVLSIYYDQYKDEMKKQLFLEKFFGYGGSHIYLDDIRIGGRIDKIQWMDPKKKTVAVIDYKTGQPRSKNDIEGKTATSTGDYKRQLLFYKLLADLDQTFGMRVAEGVF